MGSNPTGITKIPVHARDFLRSWSGSHAEMVHSWVLSSAPCCGCLLPERACARPGLVRVDDLTVESVDVVEDAIPSCLPVRRKRRPVPTFPRENRWMPSPPKKISHLLAAPMCFCGYAFQ